VENGEPVYNICLTGNKFGRCLVMKISTFTIALVKARTHGLGRLECQPIILGGTIGLALDTCQPNWASTVYGVARTGHSLQWASLNIGLAWSCWHGQRAGPTGLARIPSSPNCATQYYGPAQMLIRYDAAVTGRHVEHLLINHVISLKLFKSVRNARASSRFLALHLVSRINAYPNLNSHIL